MKHVVAIALAAAMVSGTTMIAQAGSGKGDLKASAGASAMSPGHKMQAKGSLKGTTGASGYAPGHRMQAKGSVKGTTGASGYAPGHLKADSSTSTNIKAGRSTVGAGVRVH